jgi:hypothetical protein
LVAIFYYRNVPSITIDSWHLEYTEQNLPASQRLDAKNNPESIAKNGSYYSKKLSANAKNIW